MTITDEKLYELCKKYGEQARLWRQKFAGLLPEVLRRRLYEKKGFTSIFEFAKKLCGMNEEQVRLVLNIKKRLEDKPTLKNLFVTGAVSINKLARVVSVATTENEKFWAEKVTVLPQKAIETLVKDEKSATCQNGLQELKINIKSLRAQTFEKLNLSNKLIEKLYELQQKGIDINALLLKLLKQREETIAQQKEEIATETQTTQSRYIPVKIKQLLREEYGTKCSMPHCTKPAQTIHHTQRFSLSQNHNPNYLAPLCREHHTIAHTIDLKFYAKTVRLL